jgi:hypothetical protein
MTTMAAQTSDMMWACGDGMTRHVDRTERDAAGHVTRARCVQVGTRVASYSRKGSRCRGCRQHKRPFIGPHSSLQDTARIKRVRFGSATEHDRPRVRRLSRRKVRLRRDEAGACEVKGPHPGTRTSVDAAFPATERTEALGPGSGVRPACRRRGQRCKLEVGEGAAPRSAAPGAPVSCG